MKQNLRHYSSRDVEIITMDTKQQKNARTKDSLGINKGNLTLFYLKQITSLFTVFPSIRIHLKKGWEWGVELSQYINK